jgi:uncharacterized protein
MKILVVSDNHGKTENLKSIIDRHKADVDFMVHCGDSELPYNSQILKNFIKVRGNCDIYEEFSEEEVHQEKDATFLITHGHHYRVKSTPLPISYRALEVGANVVFFGHSHIAAAEKVNGVLLINPGSIELPRVRTVKTYAIYEQHDSETIDVKFFSVDGKEEVSMCQRFHLNK